MWSINVSESGPGCLDESRNIVKGQPRLIDYDAGVWVVLISP